MAITLSVLLNNIVIGTWPSAGNVDVSGLNSRNNLDARAKVHGLGFQTVLLVEPTQAVIYVPVLEPRAHANFVGSVGWSG